MIDEAADGGDLTTVDDCVVGVAQEEAEGTYAPTGDGDLERTEPDDENCHLEVAVTDAADGRFVPEPTVRATLSPNDGDEGVGPFEGPSIRHPGLHHYGKNVEVPGDGEYDLTIEVDPPEFMCHGEENGDRDAASVEVAFEGVEVETGQDWSGPPVDVRTGTRSDRIAKRHALGRVRNRCV